MAKYPGKRGLHKGVRGNLEFALMADGVATADVYKTLATSDGVDQRSASWTSSSLTSYGGQRMPKPHISWPRATY